MKSSVGWSYFGECLCVIVYKELLVFRHKHVLSSSSPGPVKTTKEASTAHMFRQEFFSPDIAALPCEETACQRLLHSLVHGTTA